MYNGHKAEFLEELTSGSNEDRKSKDFISKLAEKHGLRLSEAENIASFYTHSEGKVKVCRGLPCSLKSTGIERELLAKYPDEELEDVSCLGYCDKAPVAWSQGKYYQLGNGGTKELEKQPYGSDFREVKDLKEFLELNGYETLISFLKKNNRDEVLQMVNDLNLRGFGGAGFPVYIKWKAVSASNEQKKFLLVNAHEGEPGTFKDRILMETNPYELLEASLIAALVVGADEIIIALKHEYLQAENTLKSAFEKSMDFFHSSGVDTALPKMRIMRVPGYYITGEESALMEAIEGKRSEPRLRPPYPAEIGLFGKPTLIDNVETLLYFLGRLREYSKDGSKIPGTKSYCLTGDVKNPGAYILPYGSPALDLISKKGGSNLSDLKAILPGGLSGGILTSAEGNVKLEFDSIKAHGAGMGTGSMIAISKDRCMVDVMDSIEEFFERESCGKCMPCRYGTKELSSLFENLKHGKATGKDIENAKRTADVMMKGSICGLGQASARMFLDSLKYFQEEVDEHVSGKCPSNICFQEAR